MRQGNFILFIEIAVFVDLLVVTMEANYVVLAHVVLKALDPFLLGFLEKLLATLVAFGNELFGAEVEDKILVLIKAL